MRAKLKGLLALLLVFALPCAALAEAVLGEYVYGTWSGWSERRAVPSDTLDVQQRQANRVLVKDVYTYSRFVYFNTDKDAWYATNTATPGTFVRSGSGKWESKSVDEPLKRIGLVNGQDEFDGHWFTEKQERRVELEPVTQYRERGKRRVECELLSPSVALGAGEKHKVEYKLAAGVGGVSFASTNAAVASVSAGGEILAHAPGSADINIMRGATRIEQVHVLVGERVQEPPEGILSIGQGGSFLAPKGGSARPGARVVASQKVKPEKRYFRFEAKKRGALCLRLLSAQILYVGVGGASKDAELCAASDEANTQLGALKLKDGSYLLFPGAKPDQVLGVDADGNARITPFDAVDEKQRWRLSREPDDALAGGTWIAPVVRNGKSYMSQNFDGKGHKGVDIGSGGERVGVVAVASGRVVYAFGGCNHDYGKDKNSKGEYADPCGKERTFGNVVIIEHENGLRTTYAHLSRIKVREGDMVVQGQAIGLSGSTGYSSSVHLHFEVRSGSKPLDPRLYVELPKLKAAITAG